LLQTKEIEVIQYTTRLDRLQEAASKAKTKKETQDEKDQQLSILQRDNTELIGGGIPLLKSYNEILSKYNALKEDYRKAEMHILELKKSIRQKKPHPERETKRKPHSSSDVEILNEIRTKLKVERNEEILIGIDKMLKILNAIPHMESFIKKVCEIVQPKDKSGVANIDEAIPKLERWKKKLNEEYNVYRNIIERLQQMCKGVELRDLVESIEGPYYLAWKLRPFIAVIVFMSSSI